MMFASQRRERGLPFATGFETGVVPPGVIDERGARPGGGAVPRINEADAVRNALADNSLRASSVAARPHADHEPAEGGHADYAGHYRMHGRNESGLFAAKPKKNFGQKVLGTLGEFALRYSAGQGNPFAMQVLKNRMAEAEHRQKAESEFQEHDRVVGILMRQNMTADQAELAALNTSKLGEEYNTRFRTRDMAPGHTAATPNLGGGGFQTYTAPTHAEAYAKAQGLEPGTEGYAGAVQDYVLRSWGDTAVGNKSELEGVRYGYRDQLQDQRLRSGERNTDVRARVATQNNIRSTSTSSANNLRSTSASRDNSIRSNTTSRANALTSAETTRGGYGYRNGPSGRGKGSAGGGRPRARNAQGQVVEFNGQAWVPVQ
jgi:hypothetical protein